MADTCFMERHPTSTVLLALLLALAMPAQAMACSIPIRQIGPVNLDRGEVRHPVNRTVARSAWGLDESWASTRPRLSQHVRTTRFGTWVNVTYRRQRAISIDARAPFDTGWMYVDDGDPATPPCQMLGHVEYQAPRVRVAETKFLVRVAAFARKTSGDTTGCVLGPDNGVRACPNLTRTIVKLKHELGTRQLRFEVVPD